MGFTTYLAFTTISCIIAIGILPIIIKAAKERGVFEKNDVRKTHLEQVSSFGGIGIILAFVAPLLVLIQSGVHTPLFAFFLALPLFVTSLLDDIYGLKITLRFSVHAAIGYALYKLGFTVVNFEGFDFVNAGATMLFTIILINAYNLIDGINGLAGGLGVIASLTFGTVLTIQGDQEMAMACFAYTGALLGYLAFNFGKKAQIFMGDNGSTVLGFLTAVMAMSILKPEVSGGVQTTNLVLVFAVISIPLVDAFKVAIMRMLQHKSPFRPDRTHIHHLFTDNFFSHPMACMIIYGWTIVQVTVAVLLPFFYAIQILTAFTILPYLLVKALRNSSNLATAAKKSGIRQVAG